MGFMLHFCPGSDRPDEFQDCGGSGVQKPHPHQDQPSRAVSWRVSLQREQTAKEHCLLCSLETQMGKDGVQRRILDRGGKSYIQFVLRGERNVNGAVAPSHGGNVQRSMW